MSGYQNFAVWGAGGIGKQIVLELLSRGVSTTVLTRPVSDLVSILEVHHSLRCFQTSLNNDANTKFAEQGATIRSFDVDATADAVEALRGIDVLISTVAIPGIASQPNIPKIAVDAGIKLFVPNEWGFTWSNGDEGDTDIFKAKVAVRTEAQKLGLPTAMFFTGLWPEHITSFGWDLKAGKVAIPEPGDAPFSATSLVEAARFVAFVLTTLPRDKLENTEFNLEVDRVVGFAFLMHAGDHLLTNMCHSRSTSLRLLCSRPKAIRSRSRTLLPPCSKRT
jgi:hypothetical protein